MNIVSGILFVWSQKEVTKNGKKRGRIKFNNDTPPESVLLTLPPGLDPERLFNFFYIIEFFPGKKFYFQLGFSLVG